MALFNTECVILDRWEVFVDYEGRRIVKIYFKQNVGGTQHSKKADVVEEQTKLVRGKAVPVL
jgi:hypothetical protein